MHCSICDRNLTVCICEDCDSRIQSLIDHPHPAIAIDWEGIKAVRSLNRFDIERDRENERKKEG